MEANARDYETLRAIVRLTRQKGWPPTVRELADEIGVSSPDTAQRRLVRLVALGLVEKGNGPRALRVLDLGGTGNGKHATD